MIGTLLFEVGPILERVNERRCEIKVYQWHDENDDDPSTSDCIDKCFDDMEEALNHYKTLKFNNDTEDGVPIRISKILVADRSVTNMTMHNP